jgi:hypothetical protein
MTEKGYDPYDPWNWNPWNWHRRPKKRYRVYLEVSVKHGSKWQRKFYRLTSNQKVHIMTDVVVGHQIINTIVYLDQNGAPMLVNPVPDVAPVWGNLAAPTIDTMSISADGSTDTVSAVGAGVDTLSVSVVVGGNVFTAVEQISISAAPQVLSSVAIMPVVV